MALLIIQSNIAQLTEVLIGDVGVTIDPTGASEAFSEDHEIAVLQQSNMLRVFLTDNVHGVNSSTLLLIDGVTPVPQDEVLAYLDTILLQNTQLGDYPDLGDRDSVNPQLVYVGRTTGVVTDTGAGTWQIYRLNLTNFEQLYADGDKAFDNIWDNRESLTYS